MAIRPLRPEQQELVISTLERATELSHDMAPDAALARAAKEYRLTENLLPYTVNAYNTGRSVETIKSGKTREEKAQDVPLARLDGVLRCLHGDVPVKKEAVSKDYLLKPAFLLEDRTPVVKKAYHRPLYLSNDVPDDKILQTVLDVREAVKSARSQLNQEFFIYKKAQQKIQEYLDNQYHMKLSDLVDQSNTAFGGMASVVLEPLSDSLDKHKRASWGHLIRVTKEPFSLVKAAIDQLEKLYEMGKSCGQQEEQLKESIKQARAANPESNVFLDAIERTLYDKKAPLAEPEEPPVVPVNKAAFDIGKMLLSDLAKAPAEFSQTAGNLIGKKPAPAPTVTPTPAANATKPALPPKPLLDHGQNAELQSLQKSVSLNNLLHSDPDLQGYDRDAVARAFNEIQMTYPRVASSTASLRPFLQRHLTAGGLDEFALKNLADLESRLVQTQNPSIGNK